MAKKKKNEVFTVLDEYNLVLSGKKKCFPNGVLDIEVAKYLLRYLMLEKLNIAREEMCKINYRKFLMEHKLFTITKFFNASPYEMLNYCFPEMEFKQWELPKVSNEFWSKKSNRLEALKWMASREGINLNDISMVKHKVNANLIKKYFGSTILKYSNDSLFELLDLYYEGKYKEWEILGKFAKWETEDIASAVKYMLEKENLHTKSEISKNICVKMFAKYGLEGMLAKACNHSPLRALQIALPEMNFTKADVKTIR